MILLINILIVDDHPVVLNGTKTLLQDIEHWHIETEQDPTQVEMRMQQNDYHLFLLDIHMKPINGIELASIIKKKMPDATVLLYTGYDLTDYYELLFDKKVDGLLSKTATKEQVVQTISATLRGELLLSANFLDFIHQKIQHPMQVSEPALTEKEREILQFVAQGLTNKAISIKLSVSQRTVENHLSKIFHRFNVQSRAEAVLVAKEHGLI